MAASARRRGRLHLVPAERLDRLGVGVLIAVVGVALICTLNVLTADTSAAAQAFFAFPVLWSASHLRSGAVALVTGTALVADGATLFALMPAPAASPTSSSSAPSSS